MAKATKAETHWGVDIDGDGEVGSARVGLLSGLAIVALVAGMAFAADNIWVLYDSDAIYGTCKVSSDLAGTSTLTVDELLAGVTKLGNVGMDGVLNLGSATIGNSGNATQTVATSFYNIAPQLIITQYLANTTIGNTVKFINSSATNVIFQESGNISIATNSYDDGVSVGLCIVGQYDVVDFTALGTNRWVGEYTDN